MTRTRARRWLPLLAALVVVLASTAGPVLAQAATDPGIDRTVTPLAAGDLPDEAVTYGADSIPGWIVSYEPGEKAALEDWANTSSERTLYHVDNESHVAYLSAPTDAMGVSWTARNIPGFGNGLAQRSYVDQVDLEIEVSYAEPVGRMDSNESWSAPDGHRYAQARTLGEADWARQGIAMREDSEVSPLEEARNVTGSDDVDATGDGYTAAVIDTGANVGEGQQRGTIYGNGTYNSTLRVDNASKNFLTNESVNVSANDFAAIEDGNGHGSHVTSTIGANTTDSAYDGYAPDANLLVLKALDDEGSGSSADIARAIRYAARNDADVISLSLGSPLYSEAIHDAIQDALDEGVTAVVVAVGNDRQRTRWTASPADSPGVIAVTASNTTAPQNAGIGYFANIGPDPGTTDASAGVTNGAGPTVAAPGMEIEAPVLTTGNVRRNESLTGTSMAAPGATGGVLQALDANPEWANESATVRGYVANTSEPIPHAGVHETGHGMLAVDELVAKNETASQRDARTDAAEARDTGWTQLSNTGGRWFVDLFGGFGG